MRARVAYLVVAAAAMVVVAFAAAEAKACWRCWWYSCSPAPVVTPAPAPAPAPSAAVPPAETERRTYSYEPGMPSTGLSSPARRPLWQLPKTDPRRHRP
jgi:hypothetical protein